MNICFTGHRPDKIHPGRPKSQAYDLNNECNRLIIKDILYLLMTIVSFDREAVHQIIVGGALGIDQMAFTAAHTVNHMYELAYGIKPLFIEIAIPFEDQTNGWPQKSIDLYVWQKIHSDATTYVDALEKYALPNYKVGEYAKPKMQLRNQYMVDESDLVLAYWDGTSGGTKNCVDYAVKKQKKIINFINYNEARTRLLEYLRKM